MGSRAKRDPMPTTLSRNNLHNPPFTPSPVVTSATVTGKANRLGPALPGFRYITPPFISAEERRIAAFARSASTS